MYAIKSVYRHCLIAPLVLLLTPLVMANYKLRSLGFVKDEWFIADKWLLNLHYWARK